MYDSKEWEHNIIERIIRSVFEEKDHTRRVNAVPAQPCNDNDPCRALSQQPPQSRSPADASLSTTEDEADASAADRFATVGILTHPSSGPGCVGAYSQLSSHDVAW